MPAKPTRPLSKNTAPTVKAEAEPAPPSVFQQRLEALGRNPLAYVLVSIVALLPCYWGAHIQAGDLSSHIYNSWLAQLVEAGKLSGLVVANQATNVLFDLILSGLFRSLGPQLAQRISVSIAVLIFIWGAFAFASAASGKRAWPVLPCIVMLAYGYVFHMGFFDFYLSLGLCFCGLATAWDPTPKRLALAAPFFVLAFLAHALAFAWGAAFLAYLVAAKYLEPERRMQLTLAGLAGLIAARVAVSSAWPTRWAADQITLITGADQLRIFDDKYYFLFFALLAVWAILFLDLIRNQGASPLHLRLPFSVVHPQRRRCLVVAWRDSDPGLSSRIGVHRRAHVVRRRSVSLRPASLGEIRAVSTWVDGCRDRGILPFSASRRARFQRL